MLRGDERDVDGHSRTSNILYQNISTPTSEFYECKHPFNPAHKPARGYIYFFYITSDDFSILFLDQRTIINGLTLPVPSKISK